MRDDHSAAATALRRIANTIASTPKEELVRLRAYLVTVGRLFRDHEVVRAALVDLRRRAGNDDELFKLREQATLGPVTEALQRIADALAPEGLVHELTQQAIQRTLYEPGRAQPRQILGDMLRDARAHKLAPLGLDDLAHLDRASEHLLQALHGFVERDPEVAPIVADLGAIRTACGDANKTIATRQFIDYLSIDRTVDRLITHAEAYEATLLPDSKDGPPHWQNGLDQDALALIERICDELDFRTVRRFALYRLRVFFEEFEYERLRDALGRPEAQRKREAILHKAMNRFLFHEGYFWITNADASRGNIDTAIVERVERAGVPPILVELKQVTDVHAGAPRATPGAVRTAIETAQGEIQRYRGFFASRPQWAAIVPFIVVVHTCIDDVSGFESDNVILIDLSNAKPSGKRGRPLHEREGEMAAVSDPASD